MSDCGEHGECCRDQGWSGEVGQLQPRISRGLGELLPGPELILASVFKFRGEVDRVWSPRSVGNTYGNRNGIHVTLICNDKRFVVFFLPMASWVSPKKGPFSSDLRARF